MVVHLRRKLSDSGSSKTSHGAKIYDHAVLLLATLLLVSASGESIAGADASGSRFRCSHSNLDRASLSFFFQKGQKSKNQPCSKRRITKFEHWNMEYKIGSVARRLVPVVRKYTRRCR